MFLFLKLANQNVKFRYVVRIVKFDRSIAKARSNLLISLSVFSERLIFNTQSTVFSFPNILFYAKFWTKVVFPQLVCPTIKTLSVKIASYWCGCSCSIIAKSRLKRRFVLSARNLCSGYFQSFFLTNLNDKTLDSGAVCVNKGWAKRVSKGHLFPSQEAFPYSWKCNLQSFPFYFPYMSQTEKGTDGKRARRQYRC